MTNKDDKDGKEETYTFVVYDLKEEEEEELTEEQLDNIEYALDDGDSSLEEQYENAEFAQDGDFENMDGGDIL